MSPDYEFAAFLSYSHHDEAWVEVLHSNLESGLSALGHEPAKVFRDRTDTGPGRSWVTQLQQGLDRAPVGIVVVSPESMASPRVEDEWEALIAQWPDWREGRLQIVRLVDCPRPPFLKPLGFVDFREHDEERYRQGLRELLGGVLRQKDRRSLPSCPADLEIPEPPPLSVPPRLRRRLVAWLEKRFRGDELVRLAVFTALKLPPDYAEAHPSAACAASAALVDYVGDDDAIKATQRLLGELVRVFGAKLPDQDELDELERELKGLKAGGGLERAWLDKVEKDYARLERYFQQDEDVDLLARVYVELELNFGSSRRAAGKIEEAEALHGAPRELRDVLELERGAVSWVTGRWVVLGDPGAGKTTLLRHLAASLAQEGTPRWVPVYESIPRWLEEEPEPEALPRRLGRRLRRSGVNAQGFDALFDQWARDGRLLLLLDGLDEVRRERRDEAEELLQGAAALWTKATLVVASRPIGYRRPSGGFTELRLLPLDRDRRRELLARWFGRGAKEEDWSAADEALATLASDRSLWELSGTPLYLTLMAMLLEEGITPDRNRASLYDQIFELLMEGKHRPDLPPMDAREVVRGVLRRLAYDMTEANTDAEPVTRLEARLLEEDLDPLRDKLERVRTWRHGLRRFFDDLAERTGILGPHDGEELDWRFWHRTFREALTAERLEEMMAKGGREAVLARAREITEREDASRWAEPYALLTGRVEEPDILVRELVGANRPLGLRALASARTLREETVPEVLGLTGDVEERAKVYAELPRLFPDGRPLLALVDRLRRETRDGTDLFWLDWVARQVAEREEELRPEVEGLLGRFFDHVLPVPPVELFTRVETPLDGELPLWWKISEGEFLMGSPEGEEGRYGDESPQHRVEMRSGFRMAAVPVTRAQYAAFDPDHQSSGFDGVAEEELVHHPVNGVTWWAAMAFCRWLSQAFPETEGARLPTEAEWEYACRAGRQTAYWSGEDEKDLDRVGWFGENSEGRTHRVGEKPANPWGLYDVHGNVDEWTVSRWIDDYSDRKGNVVENPAGVAVDDEIGADPGGGGRVIRGGSYANDARYARSAYRFWSHPGIEWLNQGFRVLLPAAPSGGS